MHVENVEGITYEELRPKKDRTPGAPVGGFPVYPELVRELSQPGFVSDDVRQARALHVSAVLSAWSYSDAATLSSIMVRMGLAKNRCRRIVVVNDSMFVRSTAYLVQSEHGEVAFLVYRGTEPFELATWATDADVKAIAVNVPGSDATVHGGFYRNQRATWFDVVASLEQARLGRSIFTRETSSQLTQPARDVVASASSDVIGKLRALYVTGHSLGGAMAVLAAFRMLTDDAYADFRGPLHGLYTFGQPMVGNDKFAELCGAIPFFTRDYVRCVYERDVVPHLPPALSGPHAHFGRLFASAVAKGSAPHWTPGEDETEQVRSFTAILAAATDVVVEQIPLWRSIASFARKVPILRESDLVYSFYDHSPTYYVACSQPPGVVSELGDF